MKLASLQEGPYDFKNEITHKMTSFMIYHKLRKITIATQERIDFEHNKKINRVLDQILLDSEQDITPYTIQTLTL